MDITRRTLYNLCQGQKPGSWSDVIYEYCKNTLHIPEGTELRNFATRFASHLDTRLNGKSHRMRDKFEKKFADWLESTVQFSMPVSSTQGSCVEELTGPTGHVGAVEGDPSHEVTLEPPTDETVTCGGSSDDVSSQIETNSEAETSQDALFNESTLLHNSEVPLVGGSIGNRKRGRPPKPFSECGLRSKQLKTQDLRLHTPDDELFFCCGESASCSGAT